MVLLTIFQVKCDRSRPVCSQCTKGGKSCKYTDQDKPKVEFVNQRQDSFTRSEEDAGSPSGTWDHVLESQVDFLNKAEKANKDAPLLSRDEYVLTWAGFKTAGPGTMRFTLSAAHYTD
jgi:hypothetical protein